VNRPYFETYKIYGLLPFLCSLDLEKYCVMICMLVGIEHIQLELFSELLKTLKYDFNKVDTYRRRLGGII
jgi:hypothetical protein